MGSYCIDRRYKWMLMPEGWEVGWFDGTVNATGLPLMNENSESTV